MSKVIVIGGGICGLGTALLLARDGHRVTVLEKDSSPPPERVGGCWDGWARKGIAQFRQPHNFMPALRLLLEEELPDVQQALVDAGAVRFDLLHPLPRWMSGSPPQEVDERLWTWTCRRPTGEWVFRQAADAEPDVELRSGVTVAGLVAGKPAQGGVPNVAGVRTSAGEEIRADLVVDASGRGTRNAQWLADIGAGPIEEERTSGHFSYHTRYFAGDQPRWLAPPLAELGSISILTLPGDSGTWSLTLFTSAGDRELKPVREAEAWTRVVAACPLHAHWLAGEPISDVLTMTGVADCRRRFARDGAPVVTGFVAVADAWACTNPSAGRGMTVGLLQARRLRDLLRELDGDPAGLAAAYDAVTERELRPWFDGQIASDAVRFADMERSRTGTAIPLADDPLIADFRLLRAAMLADSEMFRLGIEYVATLATVQEILARPGIRARVQKAARQVSQEPPPPLPAPERGQLVALVAG